MISSCVHTHTVFCDGKNTMHEMAESAYQAGLDTLGFSGHSYVELDDFGIKSETMGQYRSEAHRVKKLFEGKLAILCGIELDSCAPESFDLSGLDYIIGSAHEVKGDDGVVYIIDGTHERLVQAADYGFDGSIERLYTAYYDQFVTFLEKKKPTIVGHFDLITKFNEKHRIFDDNSSKYKDVAISMLDRVLKHDMVIELNVGAIARGYRTLPYPAGFLLERILQKNGRVIITTDAHSKATLTHWTSEAEQYLQAIGFKTVLELGVNGFYERKL